MLLFSLVFVGATIILALAIYAGWLLAKLQRQNQLQKQQMQAALTQRNTKIVESVDIIALATLQQQCELSEAAIRLYMIMDHLQGEMRVEFPTRFPALFALYDVVKDMPRGQARKGIAKQERMQLDLIRMKEEARLEPQIFSELEDILRFTGAR